MCKKFQAVVDVALKNHVLRQELAFDDINYDCQIFDIAFHPSRNIVAAGLIDGHVRMYAELIQCTTLIILH